MSRKNINTIFITFSWLAVTLCSSVLVFLLAVIFWNGISAISLEFIFSSSRNFGAEGGVLYQIIGSLLLVSGAGLICFPIAIGSAIHKSEYIQNLRIQKAYTLMVYGLNSVPSIIFGIFGLIFFVNILGTGISWFVGSIILAMMILPTVVLSTYQAVKNVPVIYRENASALGLNKWQMIIKVLFPPAMNGAITGLLLGLARAVGETAPIMLIATAFSGIDLPTSLFDPVTSLPTHILALAQQAVNPDAVRNAWGASLVLMSVVTLLSILALWSRHKLKKTKLL